MDNYNRELAATVNRMLEKNMTEPNAGEIANFHFEGKAVGGEVIDGIRKRLPKVARMIEQDYERRVCVVTEKYYTLFPQMNLLPMTADDVAKFLPLGAGVRPMGIRLCPKADDLIYRVAVQNGLALGTPEEPRRLAKSRQPKKDSKGRTAKTGQPNRAH